MIAPSSMACRPHSIRSAGRRTFRLISASAARSHFGDRWTATPFIEFFNLFNRNNPGANYVTDISALPVPVNNLANATALCPTPACSVPITSLNQLRVPAGALGDFFGPGTTVGIPFAAQVGFRLTF